MKIKVEYTWYRSYHNQDRVLNWTILEVEEESKKSITKAIRQWAKEWTGKGHITVHDVYNTVGELKNCCDIKQKKFVFGK